MRIPEGVREVIGRRLDRLSERCNQTLTIASVIGREFTLEQVKPLIEDMSEDRLLEVLEEALAAKVIEELPRAVGRYQFTHALIQETLVEELTLTRRVRLHARIAEALEKLYGEQAEAHAAELAHHFAEAESILGTEKLVRYSLLAGERALASYGWEEAQAHFEQGLAAKGASLAGTEPAKDAEAATLLFGLGRARTATAQRYQLQQAVDIVSRAFDYYEKAGDVVHAVAIAEYPLPVQPIGRTGIAGIIPRALKLVPPDSLAEARLLCNYGTELGRVENDYEGAQEALARALAIARRAGVAALEVRALAASADVAYAHLRAPEALEKAQQAIELAQGALDHQAAWFAHDAAAKSLLMAGEVEGSQRHAAALLELAETLRGRYHLAVTLRTNSRLLTILGDWHRAREFSNRGLAVAPQDVGLLGDRVLLEYEAGEFGQGEAYLERLLEIIPPAAPRPGVEYAMPAIVLAVVARITGVLDRLDVAATVGQALLASPFANPLYAIVVRGGLVLLAVLRGDMSLAGEQYGALESARGTMLGVGMAAADRLLGLLAQTMGNLDKAAEHFEEALAFCRKAGYRPELAWTCCDYADCLSGKGVSQYAPTSDQRARAMALLDEALRISSELGMRPLRSGCCPGGRY